MIEKFISPGDKVEMKSIVSVVLPDGREGVRTYRSSVYDIIDDRRLLIAMPMEKTKLILLPVDGEYDVCFMTQAGMYRANVKIVDRQKVDGVYVVIAEMTTNLHKFQRREYYRFNCIVEMNARKMEEHEVEAFAEGRTYPVSQKEMSRGIIVDISGGGTRFVSRHRFEEGSTILMKFELPIMDMDRPFLLAAKVIYSGNITNRTDEYENRVMFEYIDNTTREEIIRYIFDEERKNRKNRKGR